MKKVLYAFLILLVLYIGYGVVRMWYESRIYELEPGDPNPTEFVFGKSAEQIKDAIRYSESHSCCNNYKGYSFREKDSSFYVRPMSIYPNDCRSYSYRYKKDNALVHADINFHIYIQPISSDSTKVSVRVGENTLCYGVRLWLNFTYTRAAVRFKDIPSTTIEEYEMLRYIGKLLDELDRMPLANYSKDLSREEIMKTFGTNNPFTMRSYSERQVNDFCSNYSCIFL